MRKSGIPETQKLDAILDQHFGRHVSIQPDVEGVDGLRKVVSGLRSAFPDIKIFVDEEVYGESKAVIRWRFTGTTAISGEMPPTGKSVKV